MKGSAQRKQQQIKARKSFLHSLSQCSPYPLYTPFYCFAFARVWGLFCVYHRSDDEDVVASLMGADFCRNLRLKCFALAIVHCAPPAPSPPLPASPTCVPRVAHFVAVSASLFCLYKFYFNFL